VNRVAQHPVQAFAAALAAVGILSIMDAVMKALVLAIGIYSVSIFRSIIGFLFAADCISHGGLPGRAGRL
jgi:S-adenosylmethionine uptake transporter